MSLLTPDIGLIFWMLLSFSIVLFVIGRYGFPVILKHIDERKEYVDNSVEAARKAYEQLDTIKQEGERILNAANQQQAAILQEALAEKKRVIDEARYEAARQAEQLSAAAARKIRQEKEQALSEVKSEIAGLAMTVAGMMVKEELSQSEKQKKLIDKLIDELPPQPLRS